MREIFCLEIDIYLGTIANTSVSNSFSHCYWVAGCHYWRTHFARPAACVSSFHQSSTYFVACLSVSSSCCKAPRHAYSSSFQRDSFEIGCPWEVAAPHCCRLDCEPDSSARSQSCQNSTTTINQVCLGLRSVESAYCHDRRLSATVVGSHWDYCRKKISSSKIFHYWMVHCRLTYASEQAFWHSTATERQYDSLERSFALHSWLQIAWVSSNSAHMVPQSQT